MTPLLLELSGQGEEGERKKEGKEGRTDGRRGRGRGGGKREQRAEKSSFGFVSLTMFSPSVDYLLYSRLSPRH